MSILKWFLIFELGIKHVTKVTISCIVSLLSRAATGPIFNLTPPSTNHVCKNSSAYEVLIKRFSVFQPILSHILLMGRIILTGCKYILGRVSRSSFYIFLQTSNSNWSVKCNYLLSLVNSDGLTFDFWIFPKRLVANTGISVLLRNLHHPAIKIACLEVESKVG